MIISFLKGKDLNVISLCCKFQLFIVNKLVVTTLLLLKAMQKLEVIIQLAKIRSSQKRKQNFILHIPVDLKKAPLTLTGKGPVT